MPIRSSNSSILSPAAMGAVVVDARKSESSSRDYRSNKDLEYTREIGRRAVAVACLHLGVTECTVEVLDVLSDALIDFLEKVGNTISHNVEMSNRPSSHVNILDALDASELVLQNHSSASLVAMAPTNIEGKAATEELTSITAAEVTATDNNAIHSILRGASSSYAPSWEALAEFAFGPQWYTEGKMREEQHLKLLVTGGSALQTDPSADGLLISGSAASATENAAAAKMNTRNQKADIDHHQEMLHAQQQRWCAPYVDVVPYYPIVHKAKRVGSIPANLSNEFSLQQHETREKMEEQARVAEAQINSSLRAIPDKYWGAPPPPDTDDVADTKEDDFDDNSKVADTLKKGNHHHDGSEKIYPFFLPPLPPAYTYKSSSFTIQDKQQEQSSSTLSNTMLVNNSIVALQHHDEQLLNNTVRSSLVQMGDDGIELDDHYWGRKRKRRSVVDNSLVVPKGVSSTSGLTTSTTATPQLLIRPSSNRANRILEGSMDASTTS